MSDGGRVQMKFLVDEHTRDAAKNRAEYGELSERLRAEINRIAFGEDVQERESIKRELERVRGEKDDLRAEIRGLQTELQSIEGRENRLEEKLSGYTDDEQKYIGHLESLESRLYEGENVDEEHGGVVRASNVGKRDPEEVIEELKERNPEIPDYAFEDALYTDEEWTGVEGRVLE